MKEIAGSQLPPIPLGNADVEVREIIPLCNNSFSKPNKT